MIITLLSNASLDDYSGNTYNDIRNKILRLRSMMERAETASFSIAPLDLFYPAEFENMSPGNFVCVFAKNQLQTAVKSVIMPPGMDHSVWSIIKFLNNKLQI